MFPGVSEGSEVRKESIAETCVNASKVQRMYELPHRMDMQARKFQVRGASLGQEK